MVDPGVQSAAVTPAALRLQAEAHSARGEWSLAIRCFEQLLLRQPGDADILLQMSYVESLAGRYRAAHSLALRAGLTRPGKPQVIAELMARLRTFNEGTALRNVVERLRPWNRVPIPLLVSAAGHLSNLGLQDPALELLEEARRGDPAYPPTLLARAQVLTYLGRFDDARRELRAVMSRAPEIARSYWLKSRLVGPTVDADDVLKVRALLARPGLSPGDAALLGYALHALLDASGDHDGAWVALEGACAAKRGTLVYGEAQSVKLVQALVSMPPLMPAEATGTSDRVPIFIVGMHRSGTTLLEQLVGGSRDVQGLGELYDFTSGMRQATDHHCRGVLDTTIVQRAGEGTIDFESVGRGYLDGVEWRLGGQRFFTDKLPSNYLNLGFICAALPQAKILHIHRDPMETCFSNLRELFSEANPYSYDQRELAAYYLLYQRLMAHWQQCLAGRILHVDYADLVSDPERAMRQVATFCGLPFEPGMASVQGRTRAVATASAVSVRSEVARREVPKWLPYARHLLPLRRALAAGGAIPAFE